MVDVDIRDMVRHRAFVRAFVRATDRLAKYSRLHQVRSPHNSNRLRIFSQYTHAHLKFKIGACNGCNQPDIEKSKTVHVEDTLGKHYGAEYNLQYTHVLTNFRVGIRNGCDQRVECRRGEQLGYDLQPSIVHKYLSFLIPLTTSSITRVNVTLDDGIYN